MKRCAFTIAFFLSLAAHASAEHLRVYLLGGQSNGNGRGDASQLAEPLASPQTDVRFYWHRAQSVTNAVWLTENQWIDLAPGSGHGTTLPVFPQEFGSEVSFGRAMADADPTVNIAIIKFTYGGSNLHTQWSASGVYYATFVSTVQTALDALTMAGDTYEWGGMIWHQGESDTGTANANAYETNLSNLVVRVRRDITDGQRLPFVVAGLSNSQNATIETPGTGWHTVRQAQEAVATNLSRVGFANTDGFTVRPTDVIHLDHDGQVNLGQAFAAQMLLLEAEDADRDGLLTDEEATLGTLTNDPDSDDDGQNDGFEVRAGTNPLDAESFFTVTDYGSDGTELHLEWPSKVGNYYTLERSSALGQWVRMAENIPANASNTFTQWIGPTTTAGETILARYDAQTGLNGDFNTTAFDSVDTDAATTASRLVQGGSLTGGGSASFVLANALFNSSDSGSPGFNFATVTTTNQAAARAAGDFFSFTLSSAGQPVTCEALSFYTDQHQSTGKIDVSYTTNGVETFVLQGYIPPGSNAPVSLQTVDFPDFTSSVDITWNAYLYASSSVTSGTRLDDITLHGQTLAEDPIRQYYRVRLQGFGP